MLIETVNTYLEPSTSAVWLHDDTPTPGPYPAGRMCLGPLTVL